MPTVRAPARPISPPPQNAPREGRATWRRWAALLMMAGLLAAAWRWTPLREFLDLQQLSSRLEPYRHAWYALPLVAATFVVLGVFLISVLLLILATGIAFGPWLGSLYAFAGCLTSASVGFLIGRWVGVDRVVRAGGERVKKLQRQIERNGVLAVFLIRKVPAPFFLSNLVMGASKIRYRDFLLGTALSMGPMTVALAGFGYHLDRTFEDPSLGAILLAAAFLAVPLFPAWLINRMLRRSEDKP